ncbi:MAG TPA: mandelate racemase [Hydrogenophaga sp.]|uniref:mandelate racemase/muconate lactonizing enzyme family protein n=1 Tax=Hydrogenophaga sp. TaxID=1904254 RepID=UPI0008C80AAB|nr:enolase C-terminal domain-like protein [Hydrogenophaga sp.]OGA76108.1 MAG: mandelate racemase [Burkholderiales bacterium GWE1_65_30]OGA91074.1 MAG: mandelate racemase [Burkholderiales bacterium GWF1_66_17]HAX23311.1 mandelate racemase [Hydrogenophaga sp.]HBU19203.1 mandelate racemase [Hydrogenophaga sp.]
MSKIVKVECLPVSTPLKKPVIMPNTRITSIDSVVLKITTDDGTVGFSDSGDTSSWYRGELQESIIAMVANVIAPRILLGEDPCCIEKIVGKMDLLVRDNNQAKATVDFALHDLKGKLLGVPVYELLGGRTIEAARQGWVLSAGKPEDVAAEAARAKATGFALFKMKIGYGTLQDDIDMVHAVRDTVGSDAYLTIDANGFWSYEKALHIIRKIDSAGLDLIEQPLAHWDIEGMARLRAQVRTPIYADESAQELHNLKEIIDRRAADGLFIKLQKAGGLVKSQRWLTMARLGGLPVHCGCMIGSGLEHSPSAHLWTANEWATQGLNESIGPLMIHGTMESKNIEPGTDIALNIPRFEAGLCYPNEGLGFGIDLNEAFLVSNKTADKVGRVVAL